MFVCDASVRFQIVVGGEGGRRRGPSNEENRWHRGEIPTGQSQQDGGESRGWAWRSTREPEMVDL